MPPETLNDVWQAIQTLRPAERELLRAWLDELPPEDKPSPEQEVERLLFESGVILAMPTRKVDPAAFRSWKAVEIEGKPVSEILLEDRR